MDEPDHGAPPLAIGQPVVAEPGGDAAGARFDGLVTADAASLITVELRGGSPSDFPPGGDARIRFWDAAGMYTIAGVVVYRSAVRGGLKVQLHKGNVEATQRRRFFRAFVDVPATLKILSSRGGAGGGGPLPVRARDISGGGLRIEADLALAEGDRVDLEIELGPSSRVKARAKVVARIGGKPPAFGLEFEGLPEAARDAVVRFVFACQLQKRRAAREE